MFSEKDFIGKNDILYKWKCKFCGNIFESYYNDGKPTKKCECQIHYNSSIYQSELTDFCKQYFPNLIENDRTLIKPKELDIVIPELKLAIEFNGNYWHSINNKKLGYHINKTIECENYGYRLIHVFEDDWTDRRLKILSRLNKIFNNKENEFNSSVLLLDRCWYSKINLKNYKLDIIN